MDTMTAEGKSIVFKVYELSVKTEEDLRNLIVHLPFFMENIQLAGKQMQVLVLAEPKTP